MANPESQPQSGRSTSATAQLPTTRDGRVVVVGAGVGGVAAAAALTSSGYDVAVYEQEPALPKSFMGVVLHSNAMLALRAIDLDGAALQVGVELKKMLLRSWRGATILDLPIENVCREVGAPAIAMYHSQLQNLLVTAAGPKFRFGHQAQSYQLEEDSVMVSFTNGQVAEGKVLVGADGLHSAIRAQVTGYAEPRYAGYTSWHGLAAPSDYGQANAAFESWGTGQRFGYVPLIDGSVSWYATANSAPQLREEPSQIRTGLLNRFSVWHAPIGRLIEKPPDDRISRHDVMDRPPSQKWGNGAVSLLADAAHPMTLDLGQGTCQAIEDAVILADSLTWSRHLTEGLRLYEKRRMPRAHWFVEKSQRTGARVQSANPLSCWMRDTKTRFSRGALLARTKTAFTFNV